MSSRVRRRRGARESLLAIILGSESLVAFLGGLVVYGLDGLPAGIESWWGIVMGAVMAVLLIATAGVVRYPWGVALGGVWQLVIALGAFLVPALLFVTIVFGGLYLYATIKGGALDARNAALDAQADNTNGE